MSAAGRLEDAVMALSKAKQTYDDAEEAAAEARAAVEDLMAEADKAKQRWIDARTTLVMTVEGRLDV